MIGECRANNAPFGVVRALEDGVAEVGCTAEIISVTKEYPDGRLDLVAEGRKRFEVLELNRERSFLQAEVLLVPDEPGTPVPGRQGAGDSGSSGDSVAGWGGAGSFRSRSERAFLLSRGFAAARSRLQTETAGHAVGEASASRRSQPIWKAFFPICGGRRGRARRPAATATRG